MPYNRFIKPSFTLSKRHWYNQWNKFLNKNEMDRFKSYTEYSELLNAFSDAITDSAIESQGGVYLDGVGYFCNLLIPKKMKELKHGELNLHNPYVHLPTFFGQKSTPFVNWRADRAYNKRYKQMLSKSLKSGKRYKSHYNQIN